MLRLRLESFNDTDGGGEATGIDSIVISGTPPVPPAQAQYVIVISVDGLGGTYLKKIFDGTATGGSYLIPNFRRLQNEGSSTLFGHCDNNNWETLPNHTSIVTCRPRDNSPGFNGHNWSSNGDPAVGQTIHSNKTSYVASVFDVAHDNGLRTGMYANKTKFSLFDNNAAYPGGGSYNATYGALDITGADNGRDKVDNTYINTALGGIIVDTFITQQKSASPNRYAFLHINEPDSNGHGSGWGSATWNNCVVTVDGMVGKILKLVEQDVPAMIGKTAIILTADHGNQDNPPTGADRYAVPFFVWGPGVSVGKDLYTLNAGKRQVAASYPMTTYSGVQPVRNAEANNLALKLIGLGPIPGSTFGFTQDLVISPPPAADPTVTLGLTGSPLAEAAGVATVTATLSAAHTLPVTVNLAFAGTASATTDYTASANSIVIAAGSTSGTLILTAVQDALYENPDETIVVDIDTLVNATESGSQQVTATIAGDDAAPIYRSYTGTAIADNFDGMGPMGTTLPGGWDAGHFVGPGTGGFIQQGTTGGSGAITVTDALVVDNGSHDPGTTPMIANFGTTNGADRALGSFSRTNPRGDQFLQLAIKNDTASALASITLSFRGEEWRSGNSAAQQLSVWYGNTDPINGFVAMGSGFNFNSPNNTGSNVAIDGNAAGNFTEISGTYTPATPIAPGSTFYIRWYDINDDGIVDDFFAIDDVTVTPTPVRPPNDNFANAIELPGDTGNLSGNNTINATFEVGEPECFYPETTNTVWFKWTCTKAGNFTLKTLGSKNTLNAEWDAVVGIYTGSSLAALTQLIEQDTGSEETVNLAVTPGTYYIQMGGWPNPVPDAASDIALNWSFVEPPPPLDGFIAYNDCTASAGNPANTTLYRGQPDGAGFLKDFATGTILPVTLTVASANVNYVGTGGPMPDAGTDAYNTFNGKVLFDSVAYYAAGWWMEARFTGLDPAKEYEFATSVNRGGSASDYAQRLSKFTISDTDSVTNSSTVGVTVNAPESVTFCTGINGATGYVARWTRIRCGADGAFTVRVEDGGGVGKGYAFDGLMLRETTPPNQAPVFAGYAVSGTTDQGLAIYPSKILALASDPDGDALSLTQVFGPSAQGGTVALADTVNYTPPAGYAGTDTFDVEITDARGASVRGTVTVTLTAAPTGTGAVGQNLTEFELVGGAAEMVFRGIPGRSYSIQRSTDMVTWSDLATAVAGPDGKISFTDPTPPMPQGYYRTRSN
jgi:hypothetical protein